MNIKFEFIDNKHIAIVMENEGKEKVVGRIFSPSGSGEIYTNAIQICGFTEAFDLWGCANFQKIKLVNSVKELDLITRDKKGEPLYEQAKDIQLKFDWETRKTPNTYKTTEELFENCMKCFNDPCSCEVKVNFENPYTVKRAGDLTLLPKEEKKEKQNEPKTNQKTNEAI